VNVCLARILGRWFWALQVRDNSSRRIHSQSGLGEVSLRHACTYVSPVTIALHGIIALQWTVSAYRFGDSTDLRTQLLRVGVGVDACSR
jgi:hypothetical protein